MLLLCGPHRGAANCWAVLPAKYPLVWACEPASNPEVRSTSSVLFPLPLSWRLKPSRCLIRCKQELVWGCLLELRELCGLFVPFEDPTRRLQVRDPRGSDVLLVCCKSCCLFQPAELPPRSLVEGLCHGPGSGRESGSPTVPVDDDSAEPSALAGLWLFPESQHGKLSVTSSLLQLRPELWWSVLLPSSYQPSKPACAEVVLLMNLSRTSWPYLGVCVSTCLCCADRSRR